ncbi:phosphatase PAP2 family protein [Bifidobacterium sp. 82T24]|uniref:phosphatase PAP2 family protein n=1 Tax=Bifidobacterium pluvialisilvae TaxID=2834436 RepID=UPI001C59AD33|nr:phosphatase PAP2 family protein [Bifidobacterium pluvialisilvae]MBW3088280.1 phosphatase PAP2 family protein [Bifidobacterium pluvialisilvae]
MSDKKRTKLYLEPLDGEPEATPGAPAEPSSTSSTGGAAPADAPGTSRSPMPVSFEPIGGPARRPGAEDTDLANTNPANTDGDDTEADARPTSRTSRRRPASETRIDVASGADPLDTRPRGSSIVLAAVLGVFGVAAAIVVWWTAVQTMGGQEYDNLAYAGFASSLPGWLSATAGLLAQSMSLGGLHIAFSAVIDVIIGIVAAVIVVSRKRWRLLVQLLVLAVVAFAAAELLKGMLPRPLLNMSQLNVGNTAPSGHTAMAAVAAVALACAVPRVLRALFAILGALYTVLVGCSVVVIGAHRPSDVIMAVLLVGGLTLIMLACTRGSGMDPLGTRMSSATVQIVGTVMIVGGLMATVYGLYLVWQLGPGLQYSARWAANGARVSGTVLIFAVATLVFGAVLALRHVTAAPLSKAGLVGAPPAPPKRR